MTASAPAQAVARDLPELSSESLRDRGAGLYARRRRRRWARQRRSFLTLPLRSLPAHQPEPTGRADGTRPNPRHRFAARCRRRSRSQRLRLRRIRRPPAWAINCSSRPTRRWRGRRCCRWLRSPIGWSSAAATRTRSRAGVSRFRSPRRRARPWRNSRFRATAATRSRPPRPRASGARASRSTSSRQVRCTRWCR